MLHYCSVADTLKHTVTHPLPVVTLNMGEVALGNSIKIFAEAVTGSCSNL